MKRCERKLKHKKQINDEDLNKTQETVSKVDSPSKDDPYTSTLPEKASKRNLAATQEYVSLSHKKHNHSMLIDPVKRTNYSPLPCVKSVERQRADQIKGNCINSLNNVYASLGANRDKEKYRRSVSQMRSTQFNDNLAKIFHENISKEHEIEKKQKLMEQMAQNRHRNELWQQVKQSNDLKTQLARSNMLMDEEYINM